MVVIEQVRIDIKLAKHIKVSLGLCAEPLTVTTYHNITLNQYIEYSRLGDYKQMNKPKAFPRKRKVSSQPMKPA